MMAIVVCAVLLGMPAAVETAPGASHAQDAKDAAIVAAARGVLERTIGARAMEFELDVIPREGGRDVFVLSAKAGRVRVAGSSGVAIARGAYEYIRGSCKGIVTWEGSRLNLPKRLPDCAERRVVCPNRYRHYFNVCTFGYTTVWWDWARWEREIDWMALHGINMPLAMNGQEWVWQRVWRELGVTDDELKAFFTGPAFLPWHRMGNINGHGGPLPRSFIDGQRDLQKKILQRERSLGMSPVTPGFSGFVPHGFKRAHPDATVRTSSAWAGFEPTFTLDARDPLFIDIGRRFIEAYRAEYGSDHLYLADTFNEMRPPVTPESKRDDLAAYGEAVYRSITAGDARGTWVMQGWMFLNERDFWGGPEVEALLSRVPDDRMIPLDLACDLSPVWRVHAPFRRKPWIYCTLHNFGQNTALFGNLAAYASGPIATLNDAAHGNMAGMGLTMEGIDQNAVVYELATDAMWRTSPIDVDGWIEQYLTCRYGACPAEIKAAWDVLRRVVYDGAGPSDISRYMTRPRADAGCEAGPELAELRGVVEAYLTCASQFGGHPLFLRDLVDIEKRYLAECGGPMLLEFWNAHDRGDDAGMARHSTRYLKLLLDIDLLVGTQEAYRMSNWVTAARAMGRDKAEADLMERNARMQVTVWGGPVLHDYAAKEWNGLIREFYAERWRQLFAAVRAAPKGAFDQAAWNRDIAAWEEAWTRETGVGESLATENAVSLAKRLLATYRDVESFAPADRGIAVGRPVTVSGGTEGSHRPEYAVDGSAGHRGRGWYASPYPQWLQVDLESPTRIGRVDLHTYWDGRRFYQYTIEVSTDGQAWTQVVDMSKNTRPAVGRGFSHTFPAALARFVRVNMLHNSANVGVHVTEMRVFAAS